MKHIELSDQQVKACIQDIIRQLHTEKIKPDEVMGLSRGGLIPGVMISHYLNVPFIPVKFPMFGDTLTSQTLLIVDDINDTGKTFTELESYLSSRYPNQKRIYCSLISNEASSFTVDFYSMEINKVEDPSWIVYPWERWWKV